MPFNALMAFILSPETACKTLEIIPSSDFVAFVLQLKHYTSDGCEKIDNGAER